MHSPSANFTTQRILTLFSIFQKTRSLEIFEFPKNTALQKKKKKEFFNSVKLLLENGVRQKRRSARNAEEMIKGSLKEDEAGEESTDDDDKIIPINYKKSAAAAAIHAQPLSPPSLKRTLEDIDCIGDAITVKRIKHTVGGPPTKGTTTPPTSAKTTPTKTDESSIVVTKITTPIPSPQKEPTPRSKEESALMKELVRKISTDDIRKKLKKLKQEVRRNNVALFYTLSKEPQKCTDEPPHNLR